MKKFLALILIAVAFGFIQESKAQNSYYFTESTKGAVTEWSQEGFIYGVTAAGAAADSVKPIYSYPFGYKSATNRNPRNAFSGTKIMVGCNITVAFEDVAATFTLQGSPNGTNWVDISTLDSDVTPNVTGWQWYVVDLANMYYPYYRLSFNNSGLEVEVTGRVQLAYLISE